MDKDKKSNVIDFVTRKREFLNKNKEDLKTEPGTAPVVDMLEKRNEIITEERRQVKRTILSEFIGACVVLANQGLQKVIIHDISENGLSFDLPIESGKFHQNEEIAMRIYLNETTYFPFYVKVHNVRAEDHDTVYRHGASIKSDSINEVALHHFIKFIENVSAALVRDNGDVLVSNFGGYPPSV